MSLETGGYPIRCVNVFKSVFVRVRLKEAMSALNNINRRSIVAGERNIAHGIGTFKVGHPKQE